MRAELRRRGTHHDVLRYCTKELDKRASVSHRNRADAGRAIMARLADATTSGIDTEPLGVLAGVPLTSRCHRDPVHGRVDGVTVELADVPHAGVYVAVSELAETDPTGLATRIENRVTGLGRRSNQLTESIADARREAERARAQRDRPFTHIDRLATVRRAAAELHRQMNELATQRPGPPAAAAPATASPNGRTAARQVPPGTASPRSALQR